MRLTAVVHHLMPFVAVVGGILILLMPRLLNYVVAIYLILVGVIGLNSLYHFVRWRADGAPRVALDASDRMRAGRCQSWWRALAVFASVMTRRANGRQAAEANHERHWFW
jgi:Protein of unknown function (DUF3096)